MWTKIQEEIGKLKKEGINPYCISFNLGGYRKAALEMLEKTGRISMKGPFLSGFDIVYNPLQSCEMIVLASPDDEFLYSEALARMRWTDELTKDDFVER